MSEQIQETGFTCVIEDKKRKEKYSAKVTLQKKPKTDLADVFIERSRERSTITRNRVGRRSPLPLKACTIISSYIIWKERDCTSFATSTEETLSGAVVQFGISAVPLAAKLELL